MPSSGGPTSTGAMDDVDDGLAGGARKGRDGKVRAAPKRVEQNSTWEVPRLTGVNSRDQEPRLAATGAHDDVERALAFAHQLGPVRRAAQALLLALGDARRACPANNEALAFTAQELERCSTLAEEVDARVWFATPASRCPACTGGCGACGDAGWNAQEGAQQAFEVVEERLRQEDLARAAARGRRQAG